GRGFGARSGDQVDYPDFIVPAAEAVASAQCDRGIVIGGSGNGEAIVANKVPGVRCTLCWESYTARVAREHNDANVLALVARVIGVDIAREAVRTWVDASVEGGRHQVRLDKVKSVEERDTGPWMKKSQPARVQRG